MINELCPELEKNKNGSSYEWPKPINWDKAIKEMLYLKRESYRLYMLSRSLLSDYITARKSNVDHAAKIEKAIRFINSQMKECDTYYTFINGTTFGHYVRNEIYERGIIV